MDLTGRYPLESYQYLVNTDGSKLYSGIGTQLTSLELTTSYALYQVTWEMSSSFASQSYEALFASQSFVASSSLFASQSFAATSSSFASQSLIALSSLFASSSATASGLVYTITSSAINQAYAFPFVVTTDLNAYQQLITDSGSNLSYNPYSDTFITTNITCSYLTASQMRGTASWANTSSFISPSAGAVSDMTNATGSIGASGFASDADAAAFMNAVSSSFITLNDLIAKLKSKGIIS